MDIQQITLPEQHYIYVERSSTMDGEEIAAAMGSGFGEVYGFTQAKGIDPLAMPMAVYVDMPSDGKMSMRLGFFVSPEDTGKVEGEIKSAVMPAGKAVKAVHVGPYAGLNQTHGAVWAHIEAEGLGQAMPV
ncbi:MAG: GyrI-like domain-containing protein, partial [Pseudomonadota bacterium]